MLTGRCRLKLLYSIKVSESLIERRVRCKPQHPQKLIVVYGKVAELFHQQW